MSDTTPPSSETPDTITRSDEWAVLVTLAESLHPHAAELLTEAYSLGVSVGTKRTWDSVIRRVVDHGAEVEVLTRAARRIREELVCCDIYDKDAHTLRAGKVHSICFWGEAAARLCEDERDRLTGETTNKSHDTTKG